MAIPERLAYVVSKHVDIVPVASPVAPRQLRCSSLPSPKELSQIETPPGRSTITRVMLELYLSNKFINSNESSRPLKLETANEGNSTTHELY